MQKIGEIAKKHIRSNAEPTHFYSKATGKIHEVGESSVTAHARFRFQTAQQMWCSAGISKCA